MNLLGTSHETNTVNAPNLIMFINYKLLILINSDEIEMLITHYRINVLYTTGVDITIVLVITD